jgi:hypothetical protein
VPQRFVGVFDRTKTAIRRIPCDPAAHQGHELIVKPSHSPIMIAEAGFPER